MILSCALKIIMACSHDNTLVSFNHMFVREASVRTAISEKEIAAQLCQESRFDFKAVNKKTGDYGIAQINVKIWEKEFGYVDREKLVVDPSYQMILYTDILNKKKNIFDYHSKTKDIREIYKNKILKIIKKNC